MNKIKVLIIDDSAVTRKLMESILSESSKIEVVGTAMDPYIAVNKIKLTKPDILTLDIEMPRMDGITFLSKIMISNPMPVIMVSSLTSQGAKETIRALQLGAIDFICKPISREPDEMAEFSRSLIEKVLIASSARIFNRGISKSAQSNNSGIDSIFTGKIEKKVTLQSDTVIALGASTGGTLVIEEILTNLTENVPGIVITQHMPEKFTYEYAERVNKLSKILVKEAEDGDRLFRGMAIIAPGGKHMLLKKDGKNFMVKIDDGPPVNRFKPSVDVMFKSVSIAAPSSSIGILCTGMGKDGAEGLLEMKKSGSYTIAQDEASCAVYGMPKEAVHIGAAAIQMNIRSMIDFINSKANK